LWAGGLILASALIGTLAYSISRPTDTYDTPTQNVAPFSASGVPTGSKTISRPTDTPPQTFVSSSTRGVPTVIPAEIPTIFPTVSRRVIGVDSKITVEDADDSYFGWSTAISENTMAVGAYRYNNERGAVYLYQKSSSDDSWELEATIEASDGIDGDSFGWKVAMTGDVVVVGTPYADNGRGSAYVVSREAEGVWVES